METVNAILLFLCTVLPLAGAVITFIAKFLKSNKAKKIAEGLLKTANTIEELMVEAEKFEGYTGQQKKEYVLKRAKNYVLSDGLDFDETGASEVLEKLINFSKDVNKKHFVAPPTLPQKTRNTKKNNLTNESITDDEVKK